MKPGRKSAAKAAVVVAVVVTGAETGAVVAAVATAGSFLPNEEKRKRGNRPGCPFFYGSRELPLDRLRFHLESPTGRLIQ
jgi:hypothetical protein